jgi:hypothetical protein
MNSININNDKFKLEIPLLLIVFNRPKLTKKLLKSIKSVKPKIIYIAGDGPRNNNLNDAALCNEVKETFNTDIDWDCKIIKKFRIKNIGLKDNINSALDWFFENEDMGIIIEDDCEINKSFFKFCEELLNKYKDNDKIKVISGNYYFANLLKKDSYYFSKCPGTHGWASWKRAWIENDKEMKSWRGYSDLIWLVYFFKFNIVKAHYFYKKFYESYHKIINSWDYQLLYSIWKSDGLIIRPYKSLSKHIGWGEEATHSKRPDQHPEVKIEELNFPLEHPKNFVFNDKLDDLEIKKIRNVNFFKYIFYKIKKKINYFSEAK